MGQFHSVGGLMTNVAAILFCLTCDSPTVLCQFMNLNPFLFFLLVNVHLIAVGANGNF